MLLLFFQWVLLIPFVVSDFALDREKRRTGDQPQQGKCNYFNWGGTSGVHFYICCNNCGASDNSCDGTTYQSASSTTYCDRCGVDNSKGDGTHQETLSCGGCSGQESVSGGCKHWYNSIPGTCWIFTWCFRKKCKKQYPQNKKRSVDNMPDTCFNKVCDPGETVDNCPEDCCQNVNEECKWEGNKCNPKCCRESTCCATGGSEKLSLKSMENTLIMACAFLFAKLYGV